MGSQRVGHDCATELNWTELNSPIPVHFSSLIPRMYTFTLAISCLTTSNLPWFMDLTFQVPMRYCSYQHQNLLLSPVTSTTAYSFWFGSIPSFFLELFLHWSPVGHLPTWGVPLSVSYHFAFSYCSLGSQGKNTAVVCHSPFQWTTFYQTFPLWPTHLGWPHMAWLSFIELDKAVVHVIRLTSFLWLWFHCVCPLMPSHNTYSLANIHWIMEKEKEFQKNIYFCFIDYAKTFDCVDHNKLRKFWKRWEYQTTWPASWETHEQYEKAKW